MADDQKYQTICNRIGTLAHLAQKWKSHPQAGEFLKEWELTFAYETYAAEGDVDAFKRQEVNFMLVLKHRTL